jgi:CO/xanthine dehydrogenase Mo-binding subunit
MRDGRMANASLTNYIIPTTLDTPPLKVVMLENPYPHGPFGAKGVGEMPIDGPAPAVINALRHAGFDLREIPATPEKIMNAQRSSLNAHRSALRLEC